MTHNYNIFLVLLSFIISVFGSYIALQISHHINGHPRPFRPVLGAALALGGGGIWVMHFIGMLAYNSSIPISYDPVMTLASLVVAVVVVALGLGFVASGPLTYFRLLIGGLIAGAGVSTMHYMGMSAMQMQAQMFYDKSLVIISIVIAVVASAVAFWLAFNEIKGIFTRVVSALIMGIAVCGMHYTGMAAMTMKHDLTKPVSPTALQPSVLAVVLFFLTFALLVIGSYANIKKPSSRNS